ncbi:MAG: HAD family hydrolase [Planctomycetota bacterium]
MDIQCITFDWGDTLVTNRGNPYRMSLRRAIAALGADLQAAGQRVPAGWDEQTELAVTSHWSQSGHLQDDAEIDAMESITTAIESVCGAGACQQAPIQALIDSFFTRFTAVLQPFHGVGEVLQALKGRGYRLGILSHVPWPAEQCRAWYRRHGWDQWLDFYSFSSEVGWIKPHPAHYRHALAQAGCKPGQILHVGDHPERDVRGGRDYGFRTCLRRSETFYSEQELDDCAAEFTVLHVKELLDLLPTRCQESECTTSS